jgi:hypothetical protein
MLTEFLYAGLVVVYCREMKMKLMEFQVSINGQIEGAVDTILIVTIIDGPLIPFILSFMFFKHNYMALIDFSFHNFMARIDIFLNN